MSASPELIFAEDDPYLLRIREICGRLENVVEVIRWRRPVFYCSDKPFAAFGDTDFPHSLSFRPEFEEVQRLLGDQRTFVTSQYGEGKWLGRDLDQGEVDWDDIKKAIFASYALARSSSLP